MFSSLLFNVSIDAVSALLFINSYTFCGLFLCFMHFQRWFRFFSLYTFAWFHCYQILSRTVILFDFTYVINDLYMFSSFFSMLWSQIVIGSWRINAHGCSWFCRQCVFFTHSHSFSMFTRFHRWYDKLFITFHCWFHVFLSLIDIEKNIWYSCYFHAFSWYFYSLNSNVFVSDCGSLTNTDTLIHMSDLIKGWGAASTVTETLLEFRGLSSLNFVIFDVFLWCTFKKSAFIFIVNFWFSRVFIQVLILCAFP